MTKFLLPLLALGAVTPAVAATSDKPVTFERDGVRYVASVKTVGTVMLIDGRELDSGRTFKLRAKDGYVTGVYGASPVSYTLAK